MKMTRMYNAYIATLYVRILAMLGVVMYNAMCLFGLVVDWIKDGVLYYSYYFETPLEHEIWWLQFCGVVFIVGTIVGFILRVLVKREGICWTL